jgi:DNA-binding winged helix-turn-helix (wHTH) protein/TolB-like protein/Flp pilus assembly protein TadD
VHFYEFGPYRLDVLKRRLLRDGEPVALTPKAFDTLLLLVRQRERTVDKRELMKALWPDSFVEESNLTQQIFTLRKLLGEQPNGRPYIETLPKRGYHFAAQVTEVKEEPTEGSAGPTVRKITVSSGRRARRAAALVLITLALGAGGWWLSGRGRSVGMPSEAAPVPVRSLAVLPFRSLSPDASHEYLGLGMADALITRLGNLRQIVVRPTSAVRRYVNRDHDPVKAGRELGVDAVLDGNIQRDGDRLRLTAQLINPTTGTPFWSEQFDTQWTDVFGVEDAISEQLARALTLRLTPEDRRRLEKRHTRDRAAYEAYLRARYFWNRRTPDGHLKAIEHAKQAIDRDPRYALAYTGLADAYTLLGSIQSDAQARREALARAKAAAQQALAIDEELAEAHTSLAFVLMHADWNWGQADAHFRRAIQLNPSYPTAHHWYAYWLSARGRHEDALAAIERARSLDPTSLILNTDVAELQYFAGRYDLAIARAQETLAIDPEFILARRVLGWALEQKGDFDAAIDQLRRALDRAPDRADLVASLGHAYASAGRRQEAERAIATLEGRAAHAGADAELALIHAGLGRRDEALRYLERAYQRRSTWMILLAVDPRWNNLRRDARFDDLVRRIGLG